MFRVSQEADGVHRNSNLTSVSSDYCIWNGDADIQAERILILDGEHNRAWNRYFPGGGLKHDTVQQLPGNSKLNFLLAARQMSNIAVGSQFQPTLAGALSGHSDR